MRAVIQRVSSASVNVDGRVVSSIGKGLLILLGVDQNDQQDDTEQKMNLNLADVGGAVLVVSQFTLFGATKKGNRPSFTRAAPSELGQVYYNHFCELLEHLIGTEVKKGVFGADMKVALTNDGPVTLIIDSKNKE
jgi:D-aminoacyl-tRNA deacylase